MTKGYAIFSLVLAAFFVLITAATFLGWNNPSKSEVEKARSVRTGSLHTRHYFSGTGK